MRHSKNEVAKTHSMRRKRYAKWMDKAATLLEENGESMTASLLLNTLPDDRYSPPNANSAAQKMMKDERFGTFEDYTMDLHGHRYKTQFFFFDYNRGETDEE